MLRKLYLALECAALFIGLPLVMLLLNMVGNGAIFLCLWLLASGCMFAMRKEGALDAKALWNRGEVTWCNLRPMLLTFLVCAILIALYTAVAHPEKLLSFPREHPAFWALVMLLYPWVSVLPQEVVYRTFFFHRYHALFANERALIAVNALLFGFCHSIFHNWIAVGMTAVGGVLFARTYARRRSLALVTLEHAFYGGFIFTIGLGRYFYHAAH